MQTILETRSPKWRKAAVSAAAGAVAGFFGMIGFMRLYDSGALGELGTSELVAASVGLLYVLVAAAMGIGLAFPGLGVRFLNLEDADELLEQRRMLACSAGSTAAMGATLVVLAFAGPGGVVLPGAALAGALALFAILVALYLNLRRHMDELMRRLSQECGSLAYYLVLIVGGGWAMLAHLGFAPPPAPLDWLTMFYGLVLVAAFIANGRRGLLTPR